MIDRNVSYAPADPIWRTHHTRLPSSQFSLKYPVNHPASVKILTVSSSPACIIFWILFTSVNGCSVSNICAPPSMNSFDLIMGFNNSRILTSNRKPPFRYVCIILSSLSDGRFRITRGGFDTLPVTLCFYVHPQSECRFIVGNIERVVGGSVI